MQKFTKEGSVQVGDQTFYVQDFKEKDSPEPLILLIDLNHISQVEEFLQSPELAKVRSTYPPE